MSLRDQMSIQRKDRKRLRPYKLADGMPKGTVTEVLSIHYEKSALITADILIVAESKGKVTRGWFKYDKIKGHDGTREAVERFRPQWR